MGGSRHFCNRLSLHGCCPRRKSCLADLYALCISQPPCSSSPTQQLILIEQKEKEAAQALLARGEKQRALSALRRAKYQRSMLDKTDGQLRTLEELVSSGSRSYRQWMLCVFDRVGGSDWHS